jgi:PhnB protein
MAPKPIPEGYHTVSPYLVVDDAARAIEYYAKAFGANELVRMQAPGDRVGHAELELGDSRIMLSDPFPQASDATAEGAGRDERERVHVRRGCRRGGAAGGRAGATVTMEVADQFWGDRFGAITDPFGHVWSIATHVEDVPPEEMAERAKAAMAAMSSS